MNVSLRRACFGARRIPLSLALPSQRPALIAFSSLRVLQSQKPPRYFPTKQEQQQQPNDAEIAHVKFRQKYKRQENVKSSLVIAILAANTAVFIAWQYDKLPNNIYHNPTTQEIHRWMDFMKDNFIRSSENIKKGYWWVDITSAFSHKNIGHFALNMMTFFSFSQLIVHGMPQVSPLGFGALCLGSILSASAAATYNSQAVGDSRGGLGASGMVSGVLTFATCAFPFMPVKLLGFIPCQMWMSTLGFFALDAGVVGSGIWSPIGHSAHIGGSIFGTLFYLVFTRGRRLKL
jgi:membrane associated rhomboid family serine protease